MKTEEWNTIVESLLECKADAEFIQLFQCDVCGIYDGFYSMSWMEASISCWNQACKGTMNVIFKEGSNLAVYKRKCGCGYLDFVGDPEDEFLLPFSCMTCRQVCSFKRDWFYKIKQLLRNL